MSELLNLVGLSAGVVLYTMLLVMVLRTSRRPMGSRFDPLLLGTAVLGLLWNLCALPAYELPKAGFHGPFPLLTAVGFSALGFLPAVVVHSVLRGRRETVRGGSRRLLMWLAYAISSAAALMHLRSAWTGAEGSSALAMRLLTYAFVALIVPLATATRGQPGARRALWAAALATFAVSALHLSRFDRGDSSWPVELVGHHASLPLAFAILYQDYPFALADLFLKRALVLVGLLAVAFAAIASFGKYSVAFAQLGPRQVSIVVTLWVATALLYPALRRGVAWFVDAVLLHRPDYPALRNTITRRVQAHDDIAGVLDDICALLRPALSASRVGWSEWTRGASDDDTNVIVDGDETIAVVPAAESPQYALRVGGITGGRRLFSDDVAALDAIAVIAARRIDAIRITLERYARELRDREIARLATESELRTLRAQLNPHFLFNALTTIGYLIQTAPPRALETLLRLTSLLRAVLRSESELTTLGRELDVVGAYLDIERARFEQRLHFRIDVPAELMNVRVPPLVLQPIVENAVKHGISHERLGGDVVVSARLDRLRQREPQLVLNVTDTGAGVAADVLRHNRERGVGLRNLERRLAVQYGNAASLSIRSGVGAGTAVEIRLPFQRASAGADRLQGVAP
jgi:hypothetical protein